MNSLIGLIEWLFYFFVLVGAPLFIGFWLFTGQVLWLLAILGIIGVTKYVHMQLQLRRHRKRGGVSR